MKRIGIFLAVNFLVVLTISIILSVFNVQPYLNRQGLNYESLLIFCLIWGMGGAGISLLLSKKMAVWMMGVKILDPNPSDPLLKDLVDMVHVNAKNAGLTVMPEVGLYDSPEINAFATGPSRRNSLVAVSSGLLRRMNRTETEGVIAHEVAHIANGDMVTMTLVQGVINAFVMFLARVLAYVLTRGSRDDERSAPNPFAYHMTVFFLQSVLMILGSMVVAAFSRYREFRADAGSAKIAGKAKMIAALQALQRTYEIQDPRENSEAFQSMKISGRGGIFSLLATHPSLEDRIAALENMKD